MYISFLHYVIILLCISYGNFVYAHNFLGSQNIKCTVQKESYNDYEPKKINVTNNLLHKYDEIHNTSKEIIIYGRLLDKNCNPVSNQKIEIWHCDTDGKYPYLTLRNDLNNKYIKNNSDSTFIGSGTAFTNNKGEFAFITQYPGKTLGSKPYISLRVKYNNIIFFNNESYETKIFLAKSKILNRYDKVLYLQNVMDIENISDITVYKIQVVVPV